jgi:DNA replication and repair protein RecF
MLSHFRSHMRAELSLGPEPVAIFGANGSGKTNILEAISLLSPGRGLRRSSAEEMTRRPEALGWKLRAHLAAQGQTHELEIWSEAGSPRQTRIDGKATPQTGLGRLARVLWLIPAMDRLWIEGAEGRRRFLDRMTLSFDPSHADTSLTYEKAMRERNRLLKEGISDPVWYRIVETQMAEAGAKIHESRLRTLEKITQAQNNAETAFPTARLELEHPEFNDPFTAEGFGQALADWRGRDMAAGRSLIGPHRADLVGVYHTKDVAARDCSTGEQKALLVSLILANARALAGETGAAPLLLLDEVGAHLDADRRAALYSEIRALGAQAWMTGTEAHLFDSLGPGAQYLTVTETDGVSRVEQLS